VNNTITMCRLLRYNHASTSAQRLLNLSYKIKKIPRIQFETGPSSLHSRYVILSIAHERLVSCLPSYVFFGHEPGRDKQKREGFKCTDFFQIKHKCKLSSNTNANFLLTCSLFIPCPLFVTCLPQCDRRRVQAPLAHGRQKVIISNKAFRPW